MSSIEIIFSGYKILSKNPNSINIKALNQFWGNFLGKIRFNHEFGRRQMIFN